MSESVLNNLSVEIHNIVNETDDINSLLNLWKEINIGLKAFNELNERVKTKIKTYLKERQWKNYKDNTSQISVTISNYKTEKIDKQQLKMILSEAEMAQVTRIITTERMQIITPETRERLKKIVKKPRKIGQQTS